MRITGGKAARHLLKVPKGLSVRPTPDLVKQAIFNSLGPRVAGARILELFAGTGALSLECLSRGAVSAVCVEKSSRYAEILRRNIESAGFASDTLRVRVQDVFTAIPQMRASGDKFDLVLADPPYGAKNLGRRSTSFAQQLLDNPELPNLLAPDGLLILGHTKRDTLDLTSAWIERKMLKHGDSVFRFLRSASASQALPQADSSPATGERRVLI
jgi:16S rRNA (guanine966-N2)-methyltransferase